MFHITKTQVEHYKQESLLNPKNILNISMKEFKSCQILLQKASRIKQSNTMKNMRYQLYPHPQPKIDAISFINHACEFDIVATQPCKYIYLFRQISYVSVSRKSCYQKYEVNELIRNQIQKTQK